MARTTHTTAESSVSRDTGPAAGRRPPRRLAGLVVFIGLVQAFAVGLVLHLEHDDPSEAHEVVYVDPILHWLRDSALAAPLSILLLFGATLAARRLTTRRGRVGIGFGAAMLWAALGAVAYAVASVPAAMVHAELFSAGHTGTSFLLHSVEEGIITMRYSFALLLLFSMVTGVPWAARSSAGADRRVAVPTPATTRGDG